MNQSVLIWTKNVVASLLGKCEGIIIRTLDYGESARILTIYSKELGKVSVMARGVRKQQSKFAGAAQLFNHGYFLFHIGSGMGTLQQAEVINGFRHIREDIFRTSYVTYMAELLDRAIEEKQASSSLYALFLGLLNYIDEGYDEEVLVNIFEVKMLSHLGITPELNRCVNCGATEGHFAFSIQEGGLICHHCVSEDRYVMPVSVTVIKLLRLFQHIDIRRLGEVTISPDTKLELRTLINIYYDRNSGLQLKSKKFLEQVNSLRDALSPTASPSD